MKNPWKKHEKPWATHGKPMNNPMNKPCSAMLQATATTAGAAGIASGSRDVTWPWPACGSSDPRKVWRSKPIRNQSLAFTRLIHEHINLAHWSLTNALSMLTTQYSWAFISIDHSWALMIVNHQWLMMAEWLQVIYHSFPQSLVELSPTIILPWIMSIMFINIG